MGCCTATHFSNGNTTIRIRITNFILYMIYRENKRLAHSNLFCVPKQFILNCLYSARNNQKPNLISDLEVAQPHFSGSIDGLSSFVAYPIPLPLEYSVELSFKILPTTMSQISLLAFLGQTGYHDEKSDHLAVSFIQGKSFPLAIRFSN